MARPLRIQYPGAYYHVTSRGNERKDILNTDATGKNFSIISSLQRSAMALEFIATV